MSVFDYPTLGARPSTYEAQFTEALSRAGATRTVGVPFRIDLDGSVAVAEGRSNIVRQEMLTLILTYLGERLMMPYYGSNIAQFVWEQQSSVNIEAFLTEIDSLVQEQFPGVSIVNLSPVDDRWSEDGELKFVFEYTYDNQIVSLPIDASRMLTEGPT